MTTVMVPTMNTRVNPNPKGSATAHVTMAAANPFERETLSIREANQPTIHSMMPGLGDGKIVNTVEASSDPEAPAASSWFGDFGKKLMESVSTNILVPYAQQEILKPPSTPQLTAPGHAPLPTMNPNQYIQPQPAKGGMTMPLVIGGIGLLVVGGIFFMGRGKGRAPARRSRSRRR